MKNTVIKITKLLSTLVMAMLFVFADTQSVDAATSTIKMGKATLLPGYIAGVRYNIKPLVGGGYAYCLDIHKSTASNVTQYYVGQMDAGVAYILQNGYPHKSFTGNKQKDSYITQGALWWYLDDTQGTSNLGNGFKSTGSDKYHLRRYVKSLVNGAKTAKKNGYKTPSVNAKVSSTTMSIDGNYYVSKEINANAKNITGKYKVTIVDAPKGTIITNVNGKKKNEFSSDKKFLVKIPVSNVEPGKTVTAKVKVTATGTTNRAYRYAPKNSSIQPMVVIQPYSKTVTDTIKVKATKKIDKSKVTIQKLDKETNKAVAGATLVIKNTNGKIVKNVVTTNKAITITGLANGEYTVEEKQAPNGYELSNKVLKFKITNINRNILVKFYNQKKHNVCSYDKETNKYYGKNGNVVTKDKYIEECTPSKVTIKKLDKETNQVVAGATLVIKNTNGTVVKRFTTTNSDYVIDGLANGEYTVEEEKAPIGYELSTEKEKFTLNNTTRTVIIKFYNIKQHNVCSYDEKNNKYYGKDGQVTTEDKYIEECKESRVIIRKLDKASEEVVSGAVLVVKDESGKVVKEFTSSDIPEEITGLANGTYTVEEKQAPEGYELSEEKITFTIDNKTRIIELKFYNTKKHNPCSYDETNDKYYDKDGNVTTKETYTNQCFESKVTINKLDKNTNNPIAGAVLVIKDANGNILKEFTTTINGYNITGLANGTYTVEEKQAPVGYQLSTEKESFTISDEKREIEVNFYNIPKDRIVTILKVDSVTGKPVAGAEIVVRNAEGEEIASFTSTNEAYILKDIEDGTYTVEEVSAPDGYFLNEEVQTFTIDSTHLSYQVTIKDIPRTCENGGKDADECMVEVPNTSSKSTPFYLIGIAIISSGLGYVYKNNKKANY